MLKDIFFSLYVVNSNSLVLFLFYTDINWTELWSCVVYHVFTLLVCPLHNLVNFITFWKKLLLFLRILLPFILHFPLIWDIKLQVTLVLLNSKFFWKDFSSLFPQCCVRLRASHSYFPTELIGRAQDGSSILSRSLRSDHCFFLSFLLELCFRSVLLLYS